MIELKNKRLQIAIEDRGAQLCSLKDLDKGRELLWSGDPKYWKYHAPVLFPFVGNMNEKKYRYKGVTYPIGQHGFAREKDFRFVESSETEAVFVLEDSEETRAIYPFAFRFRITHRLTEEGVRIKWDVTNPSGKEPLYFSVGAHPAFRVPPDKNSLKSDCFVYFGGVNELTYITPHLEKSVALYDQVRTLKLEDGYLGIRDHLFDIDTFIFEGSQITRASLCGPDKVPYVTVECDGFPWFGLWSPSDEAPFVCLEPWYGRLDNYDFTGELPQKTGILCLLPGEQFHAEYSIIVNHS